MGRKKKYAYKHLTSEMMQTLDTLINEKGKTEAYNTVLENYWVEQCTFFQNKPFAFDVVERLWDGEPVYRWQIEISRTPILWGGVDMPIEQEILFYIDGIRFYSKDIEERLGVNWKRYRMIK